MIFDFYNTKAKNHTKKDCVEIWCFGSRAKIIATHLKSCTIITVSMILKVNCKNKVQLNIFVLRNNLHFYCTNQH